jgi:hypothetical protein
MKKIALALAALTLSVSATASDWRQISESQDGSKLLMDLQSLQFQPDNGTNFTGALFQFAPGNGIFVYVIESDACTKGQGRLHYREHENGEWVTKQTYWFNVEGTRMYDIASFFLCKATEGFRKGQEERRRDDSKKQKAATKSSA